MKTEQEKEAILEQLDEFFDNTNIVDKHDVAVVSLAVIAALGFSVAKAYRGDRRAQKRAADILTKNLREAIECADPDTLPLQ